MDVVLSLTKIERGGGGSERQFSGYLEALLCSIRVGDGCFAWWLPIERRKESIDMKLHTYALQGLNGGRMYLPNALL